MKKVLLLILLASLASVNMYAQGDDSPKTKEPGPEYIQSNYPPVRAGGEDISSAVPIAAFPFNDGGTTCGAANNYSINCGCCGGSTTAPDLVYTFTIGTSGLITATMGGFDTYLYIYDESMNVIACNDDAIGLTAQLANVPVNAGTTYFLVCDGFSSACGNYDLTITGTAAVAPETPLSPWVIGLSILLIGTFIVLRKTRTV